MINKTDRHTGHDNDGRQHSHFEAHDFFDHYNQRFGLHRPKHNFMSATLQRHSTQYYYVIAALDKDMAGQLLDGYTSQPQRKTNANKVLKTFVLNRRNHAVRLLACHACVIASHLNRRNHAVRLLACHACVIASHLNVWLKCISLLQNFA